MIFDDLLMATQAAGGIEVVGVTTQAYDSSSSSVSIGVPAGAADGDLLVIVGYNDSSHTWSFSGWSEKKDSGGVYTATLAVSGTPPATYSGGTTGTGNEINALHMICLRGVTYGLIGAVDTSGASMDAPSITMASAGLIIAAYADSAGRTYSVPTGMTHIATIDDATAGMSMATYYELVSSGATGTRHNDDGTVGWLTGFYEA